MSNVGNIAFQTVCIPVNNNKNIYFIALHFSFSVQDSILGYFPIIFLMI